MYRKTHAIAGFTAPILFVITYLICAGLQPGFNLRTKAISELGALDAPYHWIWNVFGYIVPGLLIAWFGVGLYRHTATGQHRKWPLIGISLSGAFMAFSGVFPGDFNNKQALTMLLHTVGSFGSYVFFLVGAFSYPKRWRDNREFAPTVPFSLGLVWLTILFGSWPFVFPQSPAVGQRVIFLCYFLWIGLYAYHLHKAPSQA